MVAEAPSVQILNVKHAQAVGTHAVPLILASIREWQYRLDVYHPHAMLLQSGYVQLVTLCIKRLVGYVASSECPISRYACAICMRIETPKSNVTIARVRHAAILHATRVRVVEIPDVATKIAQKVKFRSLISVSQHHARPCLHGNVMDVILCIDRLVKYVASSNRAISR